MQPEIHPSQALPVTARQIALNAPLEGFFLSGLFQQIRQALQQIQPGDIDLLMVDDRTAQALRQSGTFLPADLNFDPKQISGTLATVVDGVAIYGEPIV